MNACTEERPDILLLLTDTQPRRLVGCYGQQSESLVRTPHIDALAAAGTRFAHAYTACPLCTPARAALFTGMLPSKTGAYTNSQPLGDTIKTLGQRLRDVGYRTALIGKWHLDGHDYFGTGAAPDGWEDAFWYDGRRYMMELSEEDAVAWRTQWSTLEGIRQRGLTSSLTWAHRISDRAERFLGEADSDSRPRLLVASYDEPHHPWTCPAEFIEPYLETRLPIGPSAFDSLSNKPLHQRNWAASQQYGVREPTGTWSHPMMLGCTTYVDQQMGRVIAAAQSRSQRTGRPLWIVFTSDHGDHQGAHRLNNKGPTGYEENVGVPLIVCAPQSPHGERGCVQRSVVSLLDLVPTFLEAAGVAQPECLDGKSLLPLLGHERTEAGRSAVAEYTRYEAGHDGFGGLEPLRMWVCDGWKLVINLHGTDELYHLSTDPHEMENLIDNPHSASVRDSLHTALMDWMYVHIDPQRGRPWEERPWHSIPRPLWKAPLRPVPADGYRPPYIDYDTGLPSRGVATQFE